MCWSWPNSLARAPASQSGLHRLTWKDRSKPRAPAAFCRYGLVSVCGNWRRKRPFGFLSPRADVGVSFYGAFSSVTTKWLHRLLLGRSSLNKSPNSLRIYRSAEHDSARGFDNCRASAESPREKEHRPLGHRPQFPSAFRLPPPASPLSRARFFIFNQ